MQEPVANSWMLRHQFLILRLHSLSGLLPVGIYMVIHLLTNATVLGGPASFQDQVDRIHALGPVLPLVEWTFIFLPIIFHAVVGVVIIRSGLNNSTNYPLVGNVRYTLQRATAWIALFFIFYHVFQMHGWFHADWWRTNVATPLAGGQFNPHAATSSAAMALRPVIVQIFYVIGVLSCVYHLANGLWTMGITWGVWTTAAAQHRANYLCAAFGIGLAVISLSALFGMAGADVDHARAVEQVRLSEEQSLQRQTERREHELRQGDKPVSPEKQQQAATK